MKKLWLGLAVLLMVMMLAMPALAEQTPQLMGGGSMESAAMMTDGQLIQSSLSSDTPQTQNQWYGFESGNGDVFCSFIVENMGSTGHAEGFAFVLVDKDGAEIDKVSVGSGKTIALSKKIPAGERVYAHVYGYYEAINGIFRVEFRTVADPEGEAGIPLVSGQIGAIDVKEDQDVFVYETGENVSYMDLTATNISCGGDWYVKVVDIDGVQIFDMRIYGGSKADSKIFRMEPNNRYVFTTWTSDVTGNYRFDFTVEEDLYADVMEQSVMLMPGQMLEAGFQGMNDLDYFSIQVEDVTAFQRLNLYNASAYRMDLIVYDQYFQKQAECSLRSGENTALDFKVAQSGTYYVCMDSENCTGKYAVEYLTVADGEGDVQETAVEIVPGEVNARMLESKGDVDYFAVEPGEDARTVGICLDTRQDEVELNICAYDGYGRELASHWVKNKEHSFNVEQAAGERIYISVCGKNVAARYLLQLCTDGNHVAASWEETAEATCSAGGSRLIRCRICETVMAEESVDAQTHTPGEWEIVFDASCSESGEKVLYCSVCGAEMERVEIPAMGHHETYWEIEMEVTCTSDGVQTQHCPHCNMIVARERIVSVGHVLGEEVMISEASCGEDGVIGCYCVVCGELAQQQTVRGGEHIPGEKLNINGVPSAICDSCGTIYPLPESEG